jgi:dihydroxyacetone kinase-like protein
MKKLINDPKNFVDEMLGGIYAAHPGKVTYTAGDPRCLVRAKMKTGKVGLATGGGSGHLPLFLGYVGEGMLDGCAVGGVFQSPSAEQMLAVTKAIDSGAGVIYIYGNYGGDVLNFDMAADLAAAEGISVEQIVVGEDVASAKRGDEHKRRGIAGMIFVYKVAGAAAAEGASLAEVKRIADKSCSRVRSMGVALSPCTIPQVGRPTFEINEDEMEIGMGIHGEPGIRRGPLKPSDAVVDEMLDLLLPDLPYEENDEVSILINGLGATPREELYIMFKRVAEVLAERNITVHRSYLGEFATSMEMAGASISLLRLDDELKRLLDRPADTPFFVQS